MIWARLLGPTYARALVRKIGESRRLYRRGRATPLEIDTGSYTNLYDLNLVRGHWLVLRLLCRRAHSQRPPASLHQAGREAGGLRRPLPS